MKKKKKKEDLNNNITKYNDYIWKPNYNLSLNKDKTNSWFNIEYYEDNNILVNENVTNKINFPKGKNSELCKCEYVTLKLSLKQQKIMDRWMMAYNHMYNNTLKYIKTYYIEKNELLLNYKTLRTYHLKNIRDKLIKESQHPSFKIDTTIKTHIMDGAIRLACSNYKSALTNFKEGNIKHFRIRYWKMRKPFNILDIETCYFKQNTLCPKIFGKIEAFKDKKIFNLSEIGTKYKSECKLLYNRNDNSYKLYIPEKISPINIDHSKKIIILDPGLRTFMTGLSENEVIKIGTNSTEKILSYMKKIDKINVNKNNITNPNTKSEKKIINRCHTKIKNCIKDLHWKSISYLTNKYKCILIGDLSVKGITNNENSVLSSQSKRIGYYLSFYKYRERLKYKCQTKNCKYLEVDESYTSKTCSCCGYYKENLNGSKIYKCDNCNTILDRDINGCRGIYLKSFK